jgi:hypothetical protein
VTQPARYPAGVDRVLVTSVGLRFPSAMTFPEWERAGRQLSRVVDSTMWCLGDWVAYGLDKYTDRYRHAVDAAGLDYQTLRNYTWVARRFEWSRRRPELSFQHHAEVAALPPDEQDGWLDRAVRQGWSRNQLRLRVRAARAGRDEPGDGGGRGQVLVPKLRVPAERAEAWRQAAQLVGEDLERWIIATLDNAAREAVLERDDPTAATPQAEIVRHP